MSAATTPHALPRSTVRRSHHRQQAHAHRAVPARPRSHLGADDVGDLFLRVWLEVEAGRRPLPQLRPLTSPPLFTRLAMGAPASACRQAPDRLVARHGHGDDRRHEVVARVQRGARQAVLALELRRRPLDGWWVTDLVVGPWPRGCAQPWPPRRQR